MHVLVESPKKIKSYTITIQDFLRVQKIWLIYPNDIYPFLLLKLGKKFMHVFRSCTIQDIEGAENLANIF